MNQTISLPKSAFEELVTRLNRLETIVFGKKQGQVTNEDIKLSSAAKKRYKKMDEEIKNEDEAEIDEEVFELMENHGLDQDEAEHVKEIMDTEGLDEEEAVELKDDL